jgi:hypothetical protein
MIRATPPDFPAWAWLEAAAKKQTTGANHIVPNEIGVFISSLDYSVDPSFR